jgi:hypothetical protein
MHSKLTSRAVVVAIAVLGTVGLVVGCSRSGSSETATPPPAPVISPTDNAAAATAAAPVISDADAHGFFVFGQGARCLGSDTAEMFMRTATSALVVCRSEIDRLYYRGYRISDGAGIDLYDVSRQPDGFVAVNAPDNARYVITSGGFQLIQNGTVVSSESAVEVGPAPGVQAPPPQVPSKVVFGSASARGPGSRGYGTEQPTVISMGSCANAIHDVVWQDWGAPEAHGTGLGCVQVGESPQYSLVASNIGMCQGVLAYRMLQIGGDSPYDICGG